jgi:DNA mismatch endonuclease, patch repair protein
MTDRVTREQRSRNMAAVRSSDTTPERTVRSILHGMGLRFRLYQRTLPGTPDIVLKRHETVVFVHGCFWHGHECPRGKVPTVRPDFWVPKLERNRERDRANAALLRKLGWRVLAVWECELREPTRLARRLERAFAVQPKFTIRRNG